MHKMSNYLAAQKPQLQYFMSHFLKKTKQQQKTKLIYQVLKYWTLLVNQV